MTIIVRSGDQLACRHWPPTGTIGSLIVPPPALPIVVRRKICAWLSPIARPLVKAIRPFVPESTAPAVDGRAAKRARAATAAMRLGIGVARPSHMRTLAVKAHSRALNRRTRPHDALPSAGVRGRGATSVVASPVLVGAVTILVVTVSVFLAYNANKGLPFVPTYDLSARLPNSSNLISGDEVRAGGFRIGVVDSIKPATQLIAGKRRAIAVVNMKLDQTIKPLPIDSTVIVRSRSSIGLKYIEVTVGRSHKTLRPGGTIPLGNAQLPVEVDDLLNIFDDRTRVAEKIVLTGYGDALAGRGSDLNLALQSLNPFFRFLRPVMSNLNDPRTRLREFFRNVGETSAQLAPVARLQAELFTKMADTFDALNRCPGCLQQTIEKNPPTLDTAIASLRVQRPFLADFTDLSRRLMPVADVLPVALPRINAALAAGTRVLPQTVTLDRNTERVFRALDDLVNDPSADLALNDLRDALSVT